MEQEEEAKSRKRKGVPDLALAKDGPSWDVQDWQPQAKVSSGQGRRAQSHCGWESLSPAPEESLPKDKGSPTDLTELCSLICKIGITGYHLFQALSIV